MAGTSSCSLEVRKNASVWTHERVCSNGSMKNVQQGLDRIFGMPIPPKKSALNWEYKLFQAGPIKVNPSIVRC